MIVIKKIQVVLHHTIGHRFGGFGLQPWRVLFRKRKGVKIVSLLQHTGHRGGNGPHIRRDGIGTLGS